MIQPALLSRLSTGVAALALIASPTLAQADTAPAPPSPGTAAPGAPVTQELSPYASPPEGSWLDRVPADIDEAALEELEIAEPGASTEYDRDAFGPTWADVDENGCDKRII